MKKNRDDYGSSGSVTEGNSPDHTVEDGREGRKIKLVE